MYYNAKKISERSKKIFFENLLNIFRKKFFYKNFLIAPNFFFCILILKKLNKSCSLVKKFLFLEKKIVSLKKTSFEILWSEIWKGGFQLTLILGLLGMYFDAWVVFVKKNIILFLLALDILWHITYRVLSKWNFLFFPVIIKFLNLLF